MFGWYRGEAKVIGIDGSVPEKSGWNCDAVGVSDWDADLCQGESGSGASLGVPARMSDRMCCPSLGGLQRAGHRSDDDCCVLSKSDLR